MAGKLSEGAAAILAAVDEVAPFQGTPPAPGKRLVLSDAPGAAIRVQAGAARMQESVHAAGLEPGFDLGLALGASKRGATALRIAIYLPDEDKAGEKVPNHRCWVEAGLWLMAELHEGATQLPAARGQWNPPGGGTPVVENTTLIYSYVREVAILEANVGRLAAFLHSFGKHTNQGSVMAEFSGETDRVDGGDGDFIARAYFIENYTLACADPFVR